MANDSTNFKELISKNVYFDFLGKRHYAYIFSLALIFGSVFIWISSGEKKYGTDYLGGHEIIVRIDGAANSETVRLALEKNGVEDSIVQSFELGSGEYSIRLGGGEGVSSEDAKTVKDKVGSALKASFGDKTTILKTDYVGPTIGNELRTKAFIAIALSLVGILVYVSVRFEFAFALGAVVALVHDVIVATGVYLLAGFPITVGTLAAALTIVGYSVNDTIVIFDRIREEIFKQKEFDLATLMNDCMNATISRTIITSLLTFFSALALLVLGGGAISDLSLFLVAGIVAGSYSTIFIASPIVLAWDGYRRRGK